MVCMWVCLYFFLLLGVGLFQVRGEVYLGVWDGDIARVRQHGSQVTYHGHNHEKVRQEDLKGRANTAMPCN